MSNKSILLVKPDKEQEGLITGWLQDEGHEVKVIYDPGRDHTLFSDEKYDVLIMDIDFPESTEPLLQLCRRLKEEPLTKYLPITVITSRKSGSIIANALEVGVDRFMFKPFEKNDFLHRMDIIFKEIELNKRGRKVLDLNYVNHLINIVSGVGRKDFFIISPIMFNRLILDKVMAILGEPTVVVMIKRLGELIGEDYPFIKAVKYSNGHILMDSADKASQGVGIEKLTMAYRDYVYGFLHLVRALTSDILMERM